MVTCDQHPGSIAVGTCRSCGKHFCRECLTGTMGCEYCTAAFCQAQMLKDGVRSSEAELQGEDEVEQALRSFHWMVVRIQVIVWFLTTPLFVYLGSDGWTSNRALALVMGSLGSLVLCLQLRPVMGLYWRRYLAKRVPGETHAEREGRD